MAKSIYHIHKLNANDKQRKLDMKCDERKDIEYKYHFVHYKNQIN